MIAVESEGLRFLMATDDHGVGMTLFMGDDVERRTFGHALRVLESQGLEVSRWEALLDIGAHVGTTPVTGIGVFGVENAICFEPSPRNRRIAGLNLPTTASRSAPRSYPSRSRTVAGAVEFEVAPMNPSDGRIRVAGEGPAPGAFGEEAWETIEVPTGHPGFVCGER